MGISWDNCIDGDILRRYCRGVSWWPANSSSSRDTYDTFRKLCDACMQGNRQNIQLLASSEKLSWADHFRESILGKSTNWSVMVCVSEIGYAAGQMATGIPRKDCTYMSRGQYLAT